MPGFTTSTSGTADRKTGNAVRHVVMVGNSLPRQCGIATFTSDLAGALSEVDSGRKTRVSVVAMNDGRSYDYPAGVALSIEQNDLDAYVAAARQIGALAPDAVCVQHEYGIYGGPAGSYLLTLLRGLKAPIVTTLHTVLEQPTPEQRAVLEELSALSSSVVVMSERALGILERQGVPREKLRFIPHGAPQIEFQAAEEKQRLGVGERRLILTFGLLGRGKGLEQAIRALPEVARTHPDALYLILGATHPHVLKHEGEAYREELWALARALGVEDNLRMDNRFVEPEDLRRYLAAADVYLTPYPNPAQITSGTLAYAVANGKAVVSTPYWYAEELLSDGRGKLVPFHDPQPMAHALTALLDDPQGRAEMGRRAGAFGVAMSWPQVAASYMVAMNDAVRGGTSSTAVHTGRTRPALPAFSLEHLVTLSDGTGLFQHATGAIPNPHEGYTTDDNARALQLLCTQPGGVKADQLARTYLGFMHYALDEGSGMFRNFLSYDRRWLEQVGAENAQARAVRALVMAAKSTDAAIADTARELLRRQRAALKLESPRAQAIALLAAAEAYSHPALLAESGPLLEAAAHYAANLTRLHAASRQPGWDWFEGYLSYANAELPHGLIAYGQASGDRAALSLGLRTLEWLSVQQTGPDAQFWPVGSDRMYLRGEARPFWDGQPIEASVTVSACVAAASALSAVGPSAGGLSGKSLTVGRAHAELSVQQNLWTGRAQAALAWLLGDNPLGLPLFDRRTGGCHDGLHPERLNINQGAESTVLLWQAVQDLRLAEDQRMPINLSAD